jgi:hypothetical protein
MCSYDFGLLDIPEWTEKCQQVMEELQKKTGILLNPIVSYQHEDEYPQVRNSLRDIGRVDNTKVDD